MNRREFICGLGGTLGTAVAAGCAIGRCGGVSGFRLAMAGYTLNHLKVDQALEFCEQHRFRYLCVKDFHLPFDSTAAQIATFLRKCADHGVTPSGAGPIDIRDLETAKRRFDYVAALGVKTLTGVPWQPDAQGRTDWKHMCSNESLCEKIADLATSYRINFAIHNHGTKIETGVPTLWPTPEAIMRTLAPLGPRMGLCMDIAYTHADGFDVPSVIRRYGNRIFDCHVRCISDPTNGSSGARPANRAFGYGPVFDALREVGYAGFAGLELANLNPNEQSWTEWSDWIDESRDYFEGLI